MTNETIQLITYILKSDVSKEQALTLSKCLNFVKWNSNSYQAIENWVENNYHKYIPEQIDG